MEWTTIILALIGVFASGGFWQYMQVRQQSKNGVSEKLDNISADIVRLKEFDANSLKYRDERRKKEELINASLDQNIELLKQANAATLEQLLTENFVTVVGTENRPGTGVYTTEQRERYHFMYMVYVSLGYDGRMMNKWEVIRNYPDEYGTIHPITDEERHQLEQIKLNAHGNKVQENKK